MGAVRFASHGMECSAKEISMSKRFVLGILALLVGGAYALPANADYYVVQEKSTKKCKVVETVPTDETWVQIGPVAFKTRDEADRQVTVICKERRD
jgi:hypothetical protein